MFSTLKKWVAMLLFTCFAAMQTYAGSHPAAKYNDAIVKKQHKVVKGFMKFYKTFEKGNKEKMHEEREELLALTTKYLTELQAIGDYEGDNALKESAIALFKFYKSTLETEYPHMVELIANKNRSKEDHAKLEAFKNDLITREKQHDDHFEEAQIAFSKKHKLTLIHPKM